VAKKNHIDNFSPIYKNTPKKKTWLPRNNENPYIKDSPEKRQADTVSYNKFQARMTKRAEYNRLKEQMLAAEKAKIHTIMNPQNKSGDTPLHVCGYQEAFNILMGYGADCAIRNFEGKYAHATCTAGLGSVRVLDSLTRKAPAPRRTDLRFDLPSIDNYLRKVGKPDIYKCKLLSNIL